MPGLASNWRACVRVHTSWRSVLPIRDLMDSLNRPFRRDRSVALAYIFNSSLTGFQIAIGATMPVIRADLNISLTLASLHFTIAALCGMIGANLVAMVVGRFGRRLTMIASVTVVSLALLAFCIAPSVILTLLACAAFGFAGPFALVLTQAELLDRQVYHRAIAMAELNLVVSAALVATTLGVGPLVALTGSWRIALMLPVAATFCTFFALRGLVFSDAARRRGSRTKRRMTGLAWLFCLLIICSTAVEWSYGYQGAEFLDQAGGVSKEAAATLMTLFYAGMVVSRIVLIRAVRKVAISRLLQASFVISLVGFLLLAAGPSVEFKALGLLISGLGIAVTYPTIVTLAGTAFPDATDWIVAKLYVAGGLAIGLAPFLIGALGDQVGIGRSFWTLGLIALAGLMITPFLRRSLAANAPAAN
jgi:predicted MFS family arabinose efflux permease